MKLPKMPPDIRKFLNTRLGDLTKAEYQAGVKRLKDYLKELARCAGEEQPK